MKINEEYLEIIPLNPCLAKEHMALYREGRGYLDDFLELGQDFHLYHFKYHAGLLLEFFKKPDDYPTFMVIYGKKLIGMFQFVTARYMGAVQIIYMIRKGYEGQGIASFVLKHLTNIAFYTHKYLHIELHIDVDNVASKAVAEKAGFKVGQGYQDKPYGKKGSGNMQIYTLTNPLSQEYVRQIPREEWMVNEAWQPGERYFAPRLSNPTNRFTRRRLRR
jgi:RimJ/RimL family protein N-acetyltransferase